MTMPIIRKWRARPVTAAAAATMLLPALLAGCSGAKPAGGKDPAAAPPAAALKELGKDEKATVKVMYFDKNYFFQQYGNLFLAKFPNIDIEVVSNQGIYGPGKDYKEEFKKLLDTEKPDVLLINDPAQVEELAADGRLYALDDVMKQDKFDIDRILPSVVDLIKEMGNGKMYALSPTFSSSALYYNKDLFEQYGVPLPTNQMSWEDVLRLAARFPTDGKDDERVYGLAAYSYNKDLAFPYFNAIGTTKGLLPVDPGTMTVTLQTDGWKQVLQLTADALKSGALYAPKSDPQKAGQPVMFDNYLKQNPFVTGKAAMTIDRSYLIQTLAQAKERLKDLKPVNWDIVTVPVDPGNPSVSNTISPIALFAVSATASNTRAAWEVVKYINSDEMARIQSKSSTELLARTAYMKEKDGHNLEPFYTLKPNTLSMLKGMDKLPSGFILSSAK
ncbi:ABC transporter substrate-binding protein [Gordoniibacillus kamchatkensis]|uniref:ABC transporter substrate-binding protein n=1 Tax=Gordoniibacillus kamchatkensis TaxID=1590651 RepID=UPI000B0612A7|nr:extracellular solute-binding protein [Paenibacillus sp. VKM B-2647]